MLDQHFMTDTELLQRIVKAAALKKEDTILEIGPGTGNLTKLLLRKGKSLILIEKDKELLKKLKEELKEEKNITFIQADATQQKLPEFNKSVSNLPYTICEPLLWIFTRYTFETLVLVVPDKFTELLQGYTPSRLQLLVETFYELEYLERIPKQAFDPQPKVESALIRITRKKTTTNFLPAGTAEQLPYQTITTTINVSGQYQAFKDFLHELESYVRITNIDSLTLAPGANGFDFKLSAKAYYQ